MTDSLETMRALHDFATDYRDQEREIERLRDALAIFLGHDDRFQIAVGGNPIAVDEMMESARRVLGRVGGSRK